ncbi:MerR family transcriptional regulator [Methylocella sp.]|uniref:MerR family transcriptional regulator n=1 Tax=Methylocella sp. TaxID=1978226 RepID=UPI003782F1E1
MTKNVDAFRTISEVAEELDLPQHVLRFWETRFPQIRPLKRAGGRRFYRPADVEILRAIRRLLYNEGYTIRGVQRILKEQGGRAAIVAGDAERSAPFAFEGAADPGDDAPFAETGDGRPEPADLFAPAPAVAVPPESIERLRAALRDLEDCERLLDAVRRPA